MGLAVVDIRNFQIQSKKFIALKFQIFAAKKEPDYNGRLDELVSLIKSV